MNLSDITNIREQVLAITERLDAMEAESKEAKSLFAEHLETITPEVFDQKLLHVFKAGLIQGRKEQYDEIYEHFRYNTKYVDFYAGNLNICGDIDLDDFGIVSMCEDCALKDEWADFIVTMDAVDAALKRFKPEECDTETSES